MFSDPFEWPSTSFLTYLFSLPRDEPWYQRLSLELMAVHHASNENGGAVKFLKSRLGRQKLCWQGSCRNWVWEGTDWRVFASTEGVSIEIREGLEIERAIDAWQDFRQRVGLS